MAVLQLEGESAQLRQVARMFANGDITRDDYRNIRTVMIDAFVSDLEAAPAEETPPAQRETLVAVDVPVYADAAPATARSAAAQPAAAESPMALLAILGAGAMLIIVAALAMGLG